MKNFDDSWRRRWPSVVAAANPGGDYRVMQPGLVRLARDLQQARNVIARQAAQICSLREQVRHLEEAIRTSGAPEPLMED